MASTLRVARAARARSEHVQLDVEGLSDLHAALVRERQELRAVGAELGTLEQNRLAIVHCQWQLSRALIERYLQPVSITNAA